MNPMLRSWLLCATVALAGCIFVPKTQLPTGAGDAGADSADPNFSDATADVGPPPDFDAATGSDAPVVPDASAPRDTSVDSGLPEDSAPMWQDASASDAGASPDSGEVDDCRFVSFPGDAGRDGATGEFLDSRGNPCTPDAGAGVDASADVSRDAGDVRDAGDAGDVRDASDAGDAPDAGDATVDGPRDATVDGPRDVTIDGGVG